MLCFSKRGLYIHKDNLLKILVGKRLCYYDNDRNEDSNLQIVRRESPIIIRIKKEYDKIVDFLKEDGYMDRDWDVCRTRLNMIVYIYKKYICSKKGSIGTPKHKFHSCFIEAHI